MSLDQFKRQASSFLHERFKTARLVFTDVSQAELWAEEATNTDPCSPDAKTMTRIAEASFDIDDYWRIVDVLHNRLHSTDWKQWKQSYKSLVLLEFLINHGPEEFAEEFKSDSYVIEELGAFKHRDENGFNWGEVMQKKSKNILKLLKGGETLKESRLRTLKITSEIKGFGSDSLPSPSSALSPTVSFATSRTSSFGSNSTTSPTWGNFQEPNKFERSSSMDEALEGHQGEGEGMGNGKSLPVSNLNLKGLHLWDCPPIEEDDHLIDPHDHNVNDDEEKPANFLSGVCSKLACLSPTSAERAGFRKLPTRVKDEERRA